MSRSFRLSLVCLFGLCCIADGAINYTDDVTPLGSSGGVNYYDLSGAAPTPSFTLTIDSSLVDAALTNFPVMVKLSNASGIGGTDVSAIFGEIGTNYLQIQVKDSDDNELFVEVEKWTYTGTNTNSTAYLWVKSTNVASGVDEVLTLSYSSAFSHNTNFVGVVGSAPGTSVWSSIHSAVWHISEGDTGTRFDSTVNSGDATPQNYSGDEGVQGQIDGADDLDGVDEYMTVPNSAALTFTDGAGDDEPFTISALINAVDMTGFRIVTKRKTGNDEFMFSMSGGDDLVLQCRDNSSGTFIQELSDVAFTADQGSWIQVVGTYDGSEGAVGLTLYRNGAERAGTPANTGYTAMENKTVDVWIGALEIVPDYADGEIDEVRVYNVELNAAYLKADYNSSFDSLITYSAP